jgi:predicted ATPase/class 3 adenylate cyclase
MPTGTVTLLFSDMEGSTRLLTRLGDRYMDALDSQRAILRRAWADHEGYELGTEGDSFFVAFSTAELAVGAVASAQRAMAGFAWPGDASVRVRMGLHTGAPVPHDGAYVGIDVHRAARISAAAHGGQIVVSSATASLVSGSLPDGVRLRDLGDHRLKDLESPEHVYQLDVEGLPNAFPPLRSLGATSNLPTRDFPTVGRDDELGELADLVDAGVRLLTLTGPGGAGKTTLAIAVAARLAERFAGGVYFAGLAAVRDDEPMWSSIAASTGLPAADRDADAVCAAFADRTALLVLDNLEQLPGAADGVRRLLAAAPGLVVLATSRRPLHLSAEREVDVGPLEVPSASSAAAAAASPAVQLFVNQATRVRRQFQLTEDNAADILEICRRLDGMPLGIELAAARCKLLSPHVVLSRLSSALDLSAATVDVADRHRTLRDTVEWSYELLGDEQRSMFEILGVFAGGGSLDAIAAVALDHVGREDPVDLILDLADASLARIDDDEFGDPRVTQLETVREFARERVDAKPDGAVLRERHAHYFAQLAHEMRSSDSVVALARFALDRENYLAAVEWAIGGDAAGDDARTLLGIRLLCDCASQLISGALRDGVALMERALERVGERVDADVALALATLANMYRFRGDPERSHDCARRALDMARSLDRDFPSMAYVLRTMAISAFEAASTDDIRALYDEAVAAARSGGYRQLHAALWEAGWFETSQRNLGRARALMQEALDLAVADGSLVDAVDTRHSLAKIDHLEGRLSEAETLMRDGLLQATAICDDFDLTAGADDYGALLIDVGRNADGVRLIEAVSAWNRAHDMERGRQARDDLAPALDAARAAMTEDEWQTARDEGAVTEVRAALVAALRASGGNSIGRPV